MSIDPGDHGTRPKPDGAPDPSRHPMDGDPQAVAAASEAMGTPILSTSSDTVSDEVRLPGDATGPHPGAPLDSAIDRAGRPDKVAIAMMVGVVILLLICVAFAFAAR